MDIEDLRVMYPGLDPRKLEAYVPGSTLWEPVAPLTPGWYAVSTMVEQLVPAILDAPPERVYDHAALSRLAERYGAGWHRIRQGDDHGHLAGTFHLYRVGGSDQRQDQETATSDG